MAEYLHAFINSQGGFVFPFVSFSEDSSSILHIYVHNSHTDVILNSKLTWLQIKS